MATAATPARPLPGGFAVTPAGATPAPGGPVRPPAFRIPSNPRVPAGPDRGFQPLNEPNGDMSGPAPPVSLTATSLNPIDVAAKTINGALAGEARYPDLESLVANGISSDYDLATSAVSFPFQKIRSHEIPDRIFHQYDNSSLAVSMGLFAEINHAWMTIDNALYIWDYTMPNPELIGFEEQPHAITAVKLVKPRTGVFVEAITHLLVVATVNEIFLVGVAASSNNGVTTVSLYQTKMRAPVSGLDVRCIAGASHSGRIFFAGYCARDIYELTYQQEEKWFSAKCSKHNRTFRYLPTNSSWFDEAAYEDVAQLVIDDSRDLLYALSSVGTIRVYHLRPNACRRVITLTCHSIQTHMSHMFSSRATMPAGPIEIVSLTPITRFEARIMNLVAITSTGTRIFFTATTSGYERPENKDAPTSMQVFHVKFAPSTDPQPNTSAAVGRTVNTTSDYLVKTRLGARYGPGYFFCFVRKGNDEFDHMFACAPDSGRVAKGAESALDLHLVEQGHTYTLPGVTADVGLVTKPFGATSTPLGFGNELAEQYDTPTAEVAVLTSSGIHTYRRRRLVDMFAALLRSGIEQEDTQASVAKFVRQYGRNEMAATALAVVCGQAVDVNTEARVANVTDPDIIGAARTAYIEQSGKAFMNTNSDSIQFSARHDGLALYISRLIRSVWKAKVLKETLKGKTGLTVTSTLATAKLQSVQQHLVALQKFLDANKNSIEGLAGPEALTRVRTRQDEMLLQNEHRAMNALVRLITSIIEGISFILVLFDNPIVEIILSLPETIRQQVRDLTFETLFCSTRGRDLARELVKAIVNRSIASGSNVEQVADGLRRRCGSFCSANDVLIFKAQEHLTKATDAGINSELARVLLNDSLKLFQKVAGSLSLDYLRLAVEQYTRMAFFAGAIQLVLQVAQEMDRSNRALSWIRDGSPEADPRKAAFYQRTECYDLIHHIINAVDRAETTMPEVPEVVTARRKQEAYAQINESTDEVFQTNLYDWYIGQGWQDRLLDISSPYVVSYLERKSNDDVQYANLLWRYHSHYNNFYQAALVQFQLAQSVVLDLSLAQRIEYLSRAKANASTRLTGMVDVAVSTAKQEKLREISEQLDVATVQEEVLQRLRADPRLPEERRPEVENELGGEVLNWSSLFNDYADQAGYFDICIQVFHHADYRSTQDISATWSNLIERTIVDAQAQGGAEPWEMVVDIVRKLGTRVNLSETVFPINMLVNTLLNFAQQYLQGSPAHWVTNVFLELEVPHEALISALEVPLHSHEPPFVTPAERAVVANEVLHVCEHWFAVSRRAGGIAFGSEENAAGVSDVLREAAQLLVQVPGQYDEEQLRARDLMEAAGRTLRG
ncbi:nuclear pore complex protein Nup155 [Eremomyces bilateralis CBS 781.70]|uniref:Nuclear pore complex protein Nup155 n=1 Tax=Eremomyces bilateralis CBS 781.70 TaxID=1392243 RepID=A0A6G1G619_9PEZI|nr:nuclear pore complex protein Nup155 [Eremomyces bilateralis CBS 781.70]KAF1813320.1 nuclear pore complex protein Nup155 [Eremomyces bilateralis CBS 781.70]